MKRLVYIFICFFVLCQFAYAEDDFEIITGNAPWGEVAISIDKKLLEQYEVEARPHVNSFGTRFFVYFTPHRIYEGHEAIVRKDLVEDIKTHVISTIFTKDLKITQANYVMKTLEKGQHFAQVYQEKPVFLENDTWRPVIQGIYVLPNDKIKMLMLEWK